MQITAKRVLITGGTSGIGFATTRLLLQRGASVFVTGRKLETLTTALEQLRDIGGFVAGMTADVSTEKGRSFSLKSCVDAIGGLDILINNAGGVRAGRLEQITESEIETMLNVNLLAPILLTRAALPILRQNSEGMIVNVSSGIGLVGMPFYAAYAAAKGGMAKFGEAMRRELSGEGIHVLTVYPTATDTPMMHSSRAGADQGVVRESACAVAEAIINGIETNAVEVIRGGKARVDMIALNATAPLQLDQRFRELKPALEAAVKDHSAL